MPSSSKSFRPSKLTRSEESLIKTVWNYYRAYGRHDLPWRHVSRGTVNSYHVLVSEVMLQQTQVARVLVKFTEFTKEFPTIQKLAATDTPTLLKTWKGLGYNRRALWLREAAQQIVTKWKGRVPSDPNELESLKGIGHYTARAIAAFAYNQPDAFIETNIRRVYLHHLFPNRTDVPDVDILRAVGRTTDQENPREWYWALMDYGSYLKTQIPNPNKRSKSYSVQSRFEGSTRQIRAKILWLVTQEARTVSFLRKEISDDRFDDVLGTLVSDGFVMRKGVKIMLV